MTATSWACTSTPTASRPAGATLRTAPSATASLGLARAPVPRARRGATGRRLRHPRSAERAEAMEIATKILTTVVNSFRGGPHLVLHGVCELQSPELRVSR